MLINTCRFVSSKEIEVSTIPTAPLLAREAVCAIEDAFPQSILAIQAHLLTSKSALHWKSRHIQRLVTSHLPLAQMRLWYRLYSMFRKYSQLFAKSQTGFQFSWSLGFVLTFGVVQTDQMRFSPDSLAENAAVIRRSLHAGSTALHHLRFGRNLVCPSSKRKWKSNRSKIAKGISDFAGGETYCCSTLTRWTVSTVSVRQTVERLE